MKQYFRSQYWKGQRLLLLVFLLLHVIVSCVYISWQNLTFDEKDYYGYSIKWLHGDVERNNKIYDSKTPVVAVAAVPRILKQFFSPGYKAKDNGRADIRSGRYLMVVFTLITAVYLFVWSRRLFGERAWALPLLFFLFDPLVLGFSMIVTSDMASGTCLLACAYHFWQLSVKRNLRQLVLFSMWLAIGFLCKASLLYFIPYMLIVCIVLVLKGKDKPNLKKIIGYTLLATGIVLIVMNMAYFGKGSCRPLKQSTFQSGLFRSLSSTPLIRDIPVPLPYSFVQGLDMLQYHGEIGAGHAESTHHGTFIGNRSKTSGGFWYYYLYVGLFKIPLATMLLILAGFIVILFSGSDLLLKHIWYLGPFLFFFLILSCFNPFQTGFRHFLLIYPFCFLFVAAAITYFRDRFRWAGFVAGSLLLYMLLSTSFYFPWLISYSNELILDKKMVYKKIRDSSIDYGQNIYQLERFRKKNPTYAVAYPEPKAGKYIVSSFQLISYRQRENAAWLMDYEPVAHYQYSMLLFDISQAEIDAKQKGRR